jgi:hypothetical protein
MLWPISDEVTVQIMKDFYEAAHNSGNVPEALAEVQRDWLVKLRTEKGLAQAVNLAGPFIMSSQGNREKHLASIKLERSCCGLRWIRREEREIVARNDGQRRFPLRLSAGRSRSALWQFL